MMQMLRGGRVCPAEGIAPRITRIYTCEGGGGLLERPVWVGAGHWRFHNLQYCEQNLGALIEVAWYHYDCVTTHE